MFIELHLIDRNDCPQLTFLKVSEIVFVAKKAQKEGLSDQAELFVRDMGTVHSTETAEVIISKIKEALNVAV